MSSPVVIDGDAVVFEPMFGPRQVSLVEPAAITGSGHATIDGRRVCVVGDEKRVQWLAEYFMAGYSPGEGMVSIEMLDGSQMAPCVTSEAPLILLGQQFTARFTPTVAAMTTSTPPTPDVMAPGMGRGSFMSQQMFVSAG